MTTNLAITNYRLPSWWTSNFRFEPAIVLGVTDVWSSWLPQALGLLNSSLFHALPFCKLSLLVHPFVTFSWVIILSHFGQESVAFLQITLSRCTRFLFSWASDYTPLTVCTVNTFEVNWSVLFLPVSLPPRCRTSNVEVWSAGLNLLSKVDVSRKSGAKHLWCFPAHGYSFIGTQKRQYQWVVTSF